MNVFKTTSSFLLHGLMRHEHFLGGADYITVHEESDSDVPEAGANVFVAGSAVFRAADAAATIAVLQKAAEEACA